MRQYCSNTNWEQMVKALKNTINQGKRTSFYTKKECQSD